MDEKPIVLDDKKFALYGQASEGGKGPPKLSFSVFRGNPAIIVFPNDPNDSESKPIRAAMDLFSWGSFVSAVQNAITSEPGTQYRIANKKGPPQKVFVETTTVIGKDDEGVIYISVLAKDRAKKRFDIMPNRYTELLSADGNPMDRGQASQIFAAGFIDVLNNTVQHYCRERYEPPQQGGNRGGGGGNRGGSGGGSGGGGGNNWNQGGGNNVDDLL